MVFPIPETVDSRLSALNSKSNFADQIGNNSTIQQSFQITENCILFMYVRSFFLFLERKPFGEIQTTNLVRISVSILFDDIMTGFE